MCLLAACSSGPVCEVAPTPWDAASDIHIQVSGEPSNLGGRPVFVQNASGDLLVDGVTADDGTFDVDEIPAGAFLTVDVANDHRLELATYVGLQSGETVVAGRSYKDTVDLGSSTVTVRFPQLDLPSVAFYDISFGDRGNPLLSLPHDPAQPMREVTIEQATAGPGFITAVASDSTGQYVGSAGAAVDVAPGVTTTVDVGAWTTELSTLRITASQHVDVVEIDLERGTSLRHFQFLDDPEGTPISFATPGPALDVTELHVGFADQEYSVRKASPGDVVVSDADLLPPTGDIDARATDNAAFEVGWQYAGPRTVTTAEYSLDFDGFFQMTRHLVTYTSDCSIAAPPLPDRYNVPRASEARREVSELVGIRFSYGANLTRDAARRLVFDNFDGPLDVPIVEIAAFQQLTSYSTRAD